MEQDSPLTLAEECLLLALHDERGTLLSGTHIDVVLGAAILGELILGGSVEVVREGRKAFAVLPAGAPAPEDPILRDAQGRIRQSHRRERVLTWVRRLQGGRKARHAVARGLCRRGILKAEEEEFLVFWRRQTYPERDPRPERALVRRIRTALEGRGQVDPRTATLVSIAHRGGLLRALYPRKELRSLGSRLEQLEAGEACGEAVRQAVEAAQAAVLAAVIASTVAASG